jgi:hypothetical protein
MTLWARLTWQSADPEALAERLRRAFGLAARRGGLVAGALTADLGPALLELRPWQAESASDAPRAAGRLVFEPVPGGEDPPSPVPAPLPSSGDPAALGVRLTGVAWATVDLDRAEAELDPWLAPGSGAGGESPADDVPEPHLGARTRCRGAGGLPGDRIVLCEPLTEGRLAASLARDGEGPCALYLAAPGGLAAWHADARRRGLVTTAVRPGPLGPSLLLLGGGVAGPHLIVVEPFWRSSKAAPAGTIAS